MILLGSLILIAGVALSVLTWRHDINRFRIGAVTPQGAPSRIAPEVHVLGAILSAAGATMIWSGSVGVILLVAQPLLAYAIVRPLIERFT